MVAMVVHTGMLGGGGGGIAYGCQLWGNQCSTTLGWTRLQAEAGAADVRHLHRHSCSKGGSSGRHIRLSHIITARQGVSLSCAGLVAASLSLQLRDRSAERDSDSRGVASQRSELERPKPSPVQFSWGRRCQHGAARRPRWRRRAAAVRCGGRARMQCRRLQQQQRTPQRRPRAQTRTPAA